jgi:hypothetical protein
MKKMNTSSQSNLHSERTLDFDVCQPDISAIDTQKMVASGKLSVYSRKDGEYNRDKHAPQFKRSSPRKLFICVLVILLVCVIGSGVSIAVYQTYSTQYHDDLAMSQVGIKHLQTALSLMKGLSKNPFDASTVTQAQQEFSAASAVFTQLNTDLQSLPGVGTLIPVYGARLSAALRLVPLAMEVAQAGMVGCGVLNLIITRLRDPLTTGHGLTMADLATIGRGLHQVETIFKQATAQVNALQPGDLQLDPRIGKAVAAFQKNLPSLQASLGEADQLLPALPALLGINAPANYLVELLDSTELRPTGGFIGNYGFATLSEGRLSAANITDVYLLDNPFVAAGHTLSFPAAYSWFDLARRSWSFRDSNLDADFPTTARYAEQNYSREGGTIAVQGVMAITPAFIERALAITGPISVPEYNEVVTAQNLIDRIHYYELGAGRQGGNVPSPDGRSSIDKRFTALLAERFLARIRQFPSSVLSQLLPMFVSSLRSKDLQIYFNSSPAENLLRLAQVDGTIQTPTGDSFFVVDTNIAVDKANQFITSTLDDRVSIDGDGNATHTTTIRYAWLTNGNVYGSALYRDYVRIYIPPGSTLQKQQGWQSRGTSEAFGREVWAGFYTLSYGQTRTITLSWTERGAAKKDAAGWHYQYLIQRQAGSRWMLNVQVTLPSCVVRTNASGGLRFHSRQIATLTQSLTEDVNLGIDYSC